MEAEKPPVASMLPPFLTKCYDMVNDPATDATVCWGDGEDSFVIKDHHVFARDLLPKYFKHSNFSSFMRQLSTYGFRKIDHDKWVFKNEGFVKDQKDLLKSISRKKPTPTTHHPKQNPPPKLSSIKAVEVGRFGLDDEIERLKRDKNLLMQELVTLRQHQQNTDADLHDVRRRLQGLESNQQQMLSFLAMAVQSPGFLPQLLQQNMHGRWRSNIKKKRRLPALEEGGGDELESSDKQIVMYETCGLEDLCGGDNSNSNSNGAVEGGESSPDYLEYLERMMADVEVEDGGEMEKVGFDVPDFVFDFDFSAQDVEMEASPNAFGSEELQ